MNASKIGISKIGIIGLGYVGIPLALRFHEVGEIVIGFDIDEKRIADLNAGISSIVHIPSERIAGIVEQGFEATDDFSRISEADVLIVCVPTPLSKHREPDLTFVVQTMETISPYLREGQLLSLESTTYPLTTEEVLRPIIEEQGFTIGEDFYLVYSPEREDPGNADFTTQTIPKVVGGSTPACLEKGVILYSKIVDHVVPVSSTSTAELVKLLENIHRAVNIGLVNEMKIVADKMGIDIYEVIEAAETKPFGFKAYYPGPGLGGHCIPIDPFYLTWKAREYGVHTRFIELAGEINSYMPEYVLKKISHGLNLLGKSISSSKVLILGIAYKKDVDDTRESPSIEVMGLLRDEGARVDYSDPYVPRFPFSRSYQFNLESVPLTKENLAEYDVVVILTDHTNFDYEFIKEFAPLIVDTRGRYREPNDKIVRS